MRSNVFLAWFVMATGLAATGQAMDWKQCIGCGYGQGYNAPGAGGPAATCPGVGGKNPACDWMGCAPGLPRGCCEFPATWRLNVWNGYGVRPEFYGFGVPANYMPPGGFPGTPGMICPGGCANKCGCNRCRKAQCQAPAASNCPQCSAAGAAYGNATQGSGFYAASGGIPPQPNSAVLDPEAPVPPDALGN
jgi:hypothetical protein